MERSGREPDFSGKVALVTGAASGLGRATARALAVAGAKLLLADIDREGGERVAEELEAPFRHTDVSRLDDNLAVVEAAREEHGGLDLAFLNAGVSTGCGLGDDFDPGLYRRAIGVNLDGVVFGAHAVLPALRERGGGSIVATASLAGLTAVPFDPIYAANKHAVVGLARSLGLGLAAEAIRFNAVCPGFAESAIIEPIREALEQQGLPIIRAETVAETVLRIFAGEATGECWFIQPGREPEPFRFPNLPGPRTPAEQSAGP